MMEQGRSFSGRERNCCFLNIPGSRFATVSAVSGLDFPDDGRAIAVVDWDQDGDLDLWISNRNAPRLRFMRNETRPDDRHFLMLQLQGNGTATNRDAVGARVEVIAESLEGNRLIRTVHAGAGFLGQSSKWVHFGLGRLKQVDQILVHWPGGKAEAFTGIDLDRRYQLIQGTGEAKLVAAPSREFAREPAVPNPETTSGSMRIPLVTGLPMPQEVDYTGFDGKKRSLRFGDHDKPILVVLWASWCAPCCTELAELSQRQEEIQSAGLRVVALSVDGLDDHEFDSTNAQAFCEDIQFPFPSGSAHADFVQLMTGYHHMLVALKQLLPVPTSFLIDRHGRLSVIYKGTLNIDQLLKDVGNEPRTLRERWERAALLPGRMIDHEGLFHSLRRNEANTLCAMGNAFASGNRFADAIPFFRGALEAESNFGVAHQGLAQVLEFTNQYEKAAFHYEAALKHFPDREFLHYHLGDIRARQSRWQDALEHYGEAIRCKQDYLEAHLGRGMVLLKLNRHREAANHFRRALEIDPDCEPARKALDHLGTLKRS